MNTIELFLAHAIQLEREAARRYEELAETMSSAGNRPLHEFFASMAFFSRKHLGDAMARGGFRDVPKLAPNAYQWPEGTAPETAAWVGVDAQMGGREALELALEGERRGFAYYAALAASSPDVEVRLLASQFADEEAEHVRELERRIIAFA